MSKLQKMLTEIHNAVNDKIGMSRYVERPDSVCFAHRPPATSYKPVYGQLPDRRHSTKLFYFHGHKDASGNVLT
jgi:hypothetical protein